MYSKYLCALIAVFVCSLPAAAQNTATIQGTTVDFATGKPVPGAVIIATKTTTPAARGVATSSLDGSFQIPSLPAGTYNLCVQHPAGGYLSNCQWGSTASSVAVATAQKLTGNTVRLKAGSVLKIHVDDPGQLMNQKTKEGYYPDLVMGIWSGGIFYPARVAAKAAATADYQVTVPFDTAMKFSIQSRKLALGDASKKPLASNADQQTVQRSSNAVGTSGASAGSAGSNAATAADFSYSVLSAIP